MERRLYVSSNEKEELEEIRIELRAEQKTTTNLRRELTLSAKRSNTLAQTLEKTALLYKEQISQHVCISIKILRAGIFYLIIKKIF